MEANIAKMQADTRWETRKFLIQLVLGVAASVGAGVALANWVNGRPQPAPQPIVIQLQQPPSAPAPPGK